MMKLVFVSLKLSISETPAVERDQSRIESIDSIRLCSTLFKVEWKNCVAIRLCSTLFDWFDCIRLHSTVFDSIQITFQWEKE